MGKRKLTVKLSPAKMRELAKVAEGKGMSPEALVRDLIESATIQPPPMSFLEGRGVTHQELIAARAAVRHVVATNDRLSGLRKLRADTGMDFQAANHVFALVERHMRARGEKVPC